MSSEQRLRAVAERQHQVVTYAQAINCDFSPATISRRVARGRWVRLYRGVYAVAPGGWEQAVIAACLAAGPSAFASGPTAATYWQLEGGDEEAIEVTIPRSRRCDVPELAVHRISNLDPSDVTTQRGIPFASPLLTVIQLAATVLEDILERAVDQALRRGMFSLRRLQDRLAEPCWRTAPGTGILREIVDLRTPGRYTESELESDLFGLLRRFGLPLPVPQFKVWVDGKSYRIDLAYPDQMIALESDGLLGRTTGPELTKDRERQNRLIVRLGWTVVRFTSFDVRRRQSYVAGMIADVLGLMPVRWAPRT